MEGLSGVCNYQSRITLQWTCNTGGGVAGPVICCNMTIKKDKKDLQKNRGRYCDGPLGRSLCDGPQGRSLCDGPPGPVPL